MKLQGAALASHLRSKAKKNARNANLAIKRDALQKMQTVYRVHKEVTRLEWIVCKMQSYVGIVRSSLTIVLYGAPVLVLTAGAVKAILWILF